MIRYQGGSLEAFQEIYAQLAPGLRRYLSHLAGSSEIADDLLQETFLQMHRSRAAYNPKYAVRPWVFGLARNVFLMNRRAARVRDMAHSVEFYKKLGFELLLGGESAAFSSLKAGEAFVNLSANPGYVHRWWGRVIFRVVDVDGLHRAMRPSGSSPKDRPGQTTGR